jgi:hypothetical protein
MKSTCVNKKHMRQKSTCVKKALASKTLASREKTFASKHSHQIACYKALALKTLASKITCTNKVTLASTSRVIEQVKDIPKK